jgi:hypothetical protein
MIDIAVQARTGLSPEWDRWFDEQFTDILASDEELLRAEFDDLISSSWPRLPSRPSPPSAAPRDPTPPPDDAAPTASPGAPGQPHARPPPPDP